MLFRFIFLLFTALLVSACGSGGGSSSEGPSTPTPSVIQLTSASNTLLSADSAGVQITAYVTNASNAAMSGQTVTFATNSGVIAPATATTGADGVAKATLTLIGDKTNRDIRVTATSGTKEGSVVIAVVGSKLSLSGDLVLQVGATPVVYTVNAEDSSHNAVRSSTISVTSGLGNTVSPSTLVTDQNGAATFTYTPVKAGSDTLVVSGLGALASSPLEIKSTDFIAVSPAENSLIPVGDSQTIKVRYRNGGLGVAGKTVTFTTTRGNLASNTAVTNGKGEASVNISSTTAGLATIVAQIVGLGQVNLVVQFVATKPSAMSVQASPASIPPNTSGSTNRSTIEAIVRDASGNAVANQEVSFTVVQDITNGTFTNGRAITDANGRAQVQFIPGAVTSEKDGVVIKAVVVGTDVSSTTSLTVSNKSLFITIGYGNTMSNDGETTYSKEFSVSVTDVDGKAVPNQVVTLSLFPTDYYKGYMSWSEIDGRWLVMTTASCANEDQNKNGTLDFSPINEDINGNGALTPGAVATLVTSDNTSPTTGAVTTNYLGRGTFKVQYGEQYAPWATVLITARASVVGSESQSTTSYGLAVLLDDMTTKADPAGVRSPFGTASDCANAN